MNTRLPSSVLPPELLDRLAVAEHLCPVFQPIFDGNLRVLTYEALMRVVSKEGGVLPLGAYVSQMETAGLISLADTMMAEQVGRILSHVRLPSVALNASLYTLEHRLEPYLQAIDPIRRRCDEIIVEITETAPAIDAGRLQACIGQLREAGLTVALDDAKAGHAYGHPSLIRSVKPDIVKVDGAFFHSAFDDRAAWKHLEAIIAAARSYEGRVVIEWIDTPARFEAAKALGAHGMQGFLFGRPKSLGSKTVCHGKTVKACGFTTCPIRDDGQLPEHDDQFSTRCGARRSSGARNIPLSLSDWNSVKKGHIPPKAN